RIAAANPIYDETMTSVGTAPALSFALLLLIGGALTGCAPEPAETTPSPTATATASPTPTTATPTPTPTQTPDASEPPEPPASFTTDELVQICIDATSPSYDA